MELHRAGEDYLKTILTLQRMNGTVRSVEIAEMLNISKASVSTAVKLLREGGFLTMDAGKQIMLTEVGLEIAEQISEKHRVLSELLISLGVEPEIAEADACRMEHVISPHTFERIRDYADTGNRECLKPKEKYVVIPRRRTCSCNSVIVNGAPKAADAENCRSHGKTLI